MMMNETNIRRLPLWFNLPEYLEFDIQELIDRIDGKNNMPIDCLECEIIGSNNMALMSGAITPDQAKFIRVYYASGGYANGMD